MTAHQFSIGTSGVDVITIRLSADDIEAALDAVIREVKGSIQLKGFRRGKAPVAHIKRVMWRELLAPAINDHVANLLKAWEEETGRKVYAFNVNLTDDTLQKYKRGEDLEFGVEVNVLPEPEAFDLGKIEIDKRMFEITDAELEEYINKLRERYGRLVPVEDRETPQIGDIVVADITTAYADSPENKDEAKDVELEVGKWEDAFGKLVASEIMQLFTEAKRGEELEKTIETSEGEKLVVKLLVKEIKAKQPAELNEEFFSNFGDDIKTEEEFRAKIRQDLEAQKIARDRAGILFLVGNSLYRSETGERQQMPYAYISKLVDEIWRTNYPHLYHLWENRRELTGAETNLLFKLYVEEIFEAASFRALMDIGYEFLKRKLGDTVSDEDIEEFVSVLAQASDAPPAKIRAQFPTEAALQEEALRYKLAKLVREHVKLIDGSQSQTEPAESDESKEEANE